MIIYKICPTHNRAMPLTASCETFVKEYRACWEDVDRDTAKLYEIVSEFISYWDNMLSRSSSTKDINYITMCRYLAPFGDPPTLIREWSKAARLTSSVKEELELIFFSRLRRLSYFPTKASPKIAEYVIAKDFRNSLKDSIKSRPHHPIDRPEPAITFEKLAVEDPRPDHLLLKNAGLDGWESYILELLRLRTPILEVCALTHIPNRTISRDERRVWNQLNQIWHQA